MNQFCWTIEPGMFNLRIFASRSVSERPPGARPGDRLAPLSDPIDRSFEQAPAPTLPADKVVGRTVPASPARTMFVLELHPATTTVRTQVSARELDHRGIAAAQDEEEPLVAGQNTASGLAAGMTTHVRLFGGGLAAKRRVRRQAGTHLNYWLPTVVVNGQGGSCAAFRPYRHTMRQGLISGEYILGCRIALYGLTH